MFAILETGGKQVKAIAGRYIDIEKIPQNKDEKISLDSIVMLVNGKDSKVGNPYIKGAVVKGQIIEQGKDDKVIVYKMRPKKGTRKKYGHRQYYSRVFIESIELEGKVISKAENAPPVKKQKIKEEQVSKLDSTTEKVSKKKTSKKKEE
ncbi:MAG: 50S ribosomal protein L21 [Candidatus Melainabacteria bacterium]|nr:50S ribosomal protein L21 [Candidatus Melainabacteria bacterium]